MKYITSGKKKYFTSFHQKIRYILLIHSFQESIVEIAHFMHPGLDLILEILYMETRI